jgi:hypothetical protein
MLAARRGVAHARSSGARFLSVASGLHEHRNPSGVDVFGRAETGQLGLQTTG